MIIKKSILFSIIISGCATPSVNEGTTFYVEGQKTSINVPFDLVDNRNFIDVFLNGQGPFKLILDTGGGDGVVITPDVARLLGTTITGSEQQSGAGAEKEDASLATIADVRIASIHLNQVKTIILPLEKIQHAIGFEKFDGIIGHEIFSRFVTTIDFEKNMLQFTAPVIFRKPHGVVSIPLIIDGAPYANAKMLGISGRFLIDTGDRSSLSFCGPFTDKFNLLNLIKPKIEVMTGWGVGGPIPATVGRVGELQLGNVVVKDVVARFPTLRKGGFASKEDAGIIGNGVLKRFLVTFDYSRSEMMLSPNENFADVDLFDRSGMWVGKDSESVIVFDVVKDGPAAEAGIRVGDRITSFDGKSSQTLKIDEIRSRLRDRSSNQVDIVVSSDKIERKVTLKPRDLL